MKSPEVCIVILNYNGEALLPQCLPSIIEAAQKASFPTRVVILDNLSRDRGLDYVIKNFSNVTIHIAKENRILCSYNDYLPHLTEPIVILLNNDIRVAPDFVDPLVQKFIDDPKCFLAAPKVMTFDGSKVEAGRARSGFRWGFFWCDARYSGYEKEVDIPSPTVNSGFGAFSREKFLTLGGYDSLFQPGIMEDVDLSFRAQKTSHHLYYVPQSVVYHIGQATFKKEFGKKISVIAHRNNFLFMWKNFHGPFFWVPHLFFLPLRLVFAALRGNLALAQGFFQALQRRCAKK